MGLLDDAIREHLELKKRHGAPEEEVERLADEVFGAARAPAPAEPVAAEEPAAEELPEPVADVEVPEPAEPAAPAPEPAAAAPAPAFTDDEPWLEDPDEVPAAETLDHATQEHAVDSSEYVAPDEDPDADDVLEETPDFLQETPEHDRLWFEQKPPRDFDLGS